MTDSNAGLAMRIYGNLPNLEAAGFPGTDNTDIRAWEEAADAFTAKRLEEIADVEEELELMTHCHHLSETVHIWRRIFLHEQDLLKTLKRGMCRGRC